MPGFCFVNLQLNGTIVGQVNRGKKWKEICTVVNIGSSASAAFTLKKNYIRYLFAFECKFERGGLDPAPILAEMEAQLEKKREQKKRVPSPGKKKSESCFHFLSSLLQSTSALHRQGGPTPATQTIHTATSCSTWSKHLLYEVVFMGNRFVGICVVLSAPQRKADLVAVWVWTVVLFKGMGLYNFSCGSLWPDDRWDTLAGGEAKEGCS